MLPRGVVLRQGTVRLQGPSGRCCSAFLLRSISWPAPAHVRRLGSTSSAEADPYRVLGVSRGCSDTELKKAFRKAAMRWHPDMQAGTDAGEAERMFKRVRRRFCQLAVSHRLQNVRVAPGMCSQLVLALRRCRWPTKWLLRSAAATSHALAVQVVLRTHMRRGTAGSTDIVKISGDINSTTTGDNTARIRANECAQSTGARVHS